MANDNTPIVKKYQLSINVSEGFKTTISETVEGNSLIELASKIPLCLLKIVELVKEREKNERERQEDDDIPF